MSYVYIQSESELYTVGFYHDGEWTPESDHGNTKDAASRVNYLNGGKDEARIAKLEAQVRRLLEAVPQADRNENVAKILNLCPICYGDGGYYEDVAGDGGSQMWQPCECDDGEEVELDPESSLEARQAQESE